MQIQPSADSPNVTDSLGNHKDVDVDVAAEALESELLLLFEPWLFQSDLIQATQILRPCYKMLMICMILTFLSWNLKDDTVEPSPCGKRCSDSYVTVLPTTMSRIPPILLDCHGYQPCV